MEAVKPKLHSSTEHMEGHPGGCYTCRHFGARENPAWDIVRCNHPKFPGLQASAENGCAFWEREPGAD